MNFSHEFWCKKENYSKKNSLQTLRIEELKKLLKLPKPLEKLETLKVTNDATVGTSALTLKQ